VYEDLNAFQWSVSHLSACCFGLTSLALMLFVLALKNADIPLRSRWWRPKTELEGGHMLAVIACIHRPFNAQDNQV